jgi:hypothetical protein
VLDAPRETEAWLGSLIDLAGEIQVSQTPEPAALQPDHYGFLVFLMSQSFESEQRALGGLQSSNVFRFSIERGRSLLKELRERGLVEGGAPTPEARELVMQSPYAPYVAALREVSR